ncbi:MAG: hypothetical protein RL885_16220 [Planctomycetota bacterium]
MGLKIHVAPHARTAARDLMNDGAVGIDDIGENLYDVIRDEILEELPSRDGDRARIRHSGTLRLDGRGGKECDPAAAFTILTWSTAVDHGTILSRFAVLRRDGLCLSEYSSVRAVQVGLASAELFAVGAALPLLCAVLIPLAALMGVVSASSI